jgi:ELWxxDGT repeat protein
MDGISLFKSDGTATGITLVKSIPASGFYYEPPLTLHATDDRVFFGVKSTTGQFQLWTSDGTTEGTVMLQEFQPDRAFLADLVSPDGQQVFFAADDGVHGRELWLSDGTTAGTRLVKDIAAGAAAANPSGLQPVSDILLFAATDAQSNGAVWRTNSTGTRTQKVFDLGELRNPTEFALAGNHLFFNATSPAVGNELWTIAVSTTTALTATVPAQIIGDRVGPHTIAIAVSNQGMAKVADVQLTVAFDDGVTYLGNSRNAAAARNGNTVTLNLGTIGLWYETTVELYVQLPAAATTESRYAISYTVSAAGATGLSGQTELLLAPTERYLPLIKH